MPSFLASSRLVWTTRRCRSLRSGFWFLFRSYSRCVSFLASTSAGVGSGWRSGCCAFGVAFLLGFCTGDFLAFWGPGFFRVGNWKESIKSCGLGGTTRVLEGSGLHRWGPRRSFQMLDSPSLTIPSTSYLVASSIRAVASGLESATCQPKPGVRENRPQCRLSSHGLPA